MQTASIIHPPASAPRGSWAQTNQSRAALRAAELAFWQATGGDTLHRAWRPGRHFPRPAARPSPAR